MSEFVKENFIDILLVLCIAILLGVVAKVSNEKKDLEKKYEIRIGQLEQSLEHSDRVFNRCINRERKKIELRKKLREQEEARKKEMVEKHGEDVLEGLKRVTAELPCKFKTEKWVTRIETIARVPAGSFRAIVAMKDGGPDPGLSRSQCKRLLRAIETIPYPPECVNK